MPVGDNDLAVFFADFGVAVTFGGVTAMGNRDAPLMPLNFGGGPSSIASQRFAVTLPANAFNRLLRNGDALQVDGVAYAVKAPALSEDGRIATYDLEAV